VSTPLNLTDKVTFWYGKPKTAETIEVMFVSASEEIVLSLLPYFGVYSSQIDRFPWPLDEWQISNNRSDVCFCVGRQIILTLLPCFGVYFSQFDRFPWRWTNASSLVLVSTPLNLIDFIGRWTMPDHQRVEHWENR
jgi:hypothetical protein